MATVTNASTSTFIDKFLTKQGFDTKDTNVYLTEYTKLTEADKKTLLENTYITVILPILPDNPDANSLFNVIMENNDNSELGKFPETDTATVHENNIELYKKTRLTTVLHNDAKTYKNNVLYKINVVPVDALTSATTLGVQPASAVTTAPSIQDVITAINESKIYYTSEQFSKIILDLKDIIIINKPTGPNPKLQELYTAKKDSLTKEAVIPYLGGGMKKNKVTKRKQKRIRVRKNKNTNKKH